MHLPPSNYLATWSTHSHFSYQIFGISHCCCCPTPSESWGMAKYHRTPEARQSTRPGSEVIERKGIAKERIAQRIRCRTVQNEMIGVLGLITTALHVRFSILETSEFSKWLCRLQRRWERTHRAWRGSTSLLVGAAGICGLKNFDETCDYTNQQPPQRGGAVPNPVGLSRNGYWPPFRFQIPLVLLTPNIFAVLPFERSQKSSMHSLWNWSSVFSFLFSWLFPILFWYAAMFIQILVLSSPILCATAMWSGGAGHCNTVSVLYGYI